MPKYKRGICPECKVKEGYSNQKVLYQCKFCGRWFCVKHFEPRLAFIRDLKAIVKYPEVRATLEKEWRREDGHPDFAYSRKKFEELEMEEKLRSKLIEGVLNRSKAYRKKTPKKEPNKIVKEEVNPHPSTLEKPKPKLTYKEIKSFLSLYSVSVILAIVGLGIVYWQVYSPTGLMFLLLFYVIPIPVILIGISLFVLGFVFILGTLVSAIKKHSISMKTVAIPMVFSLIIFSFFGVTVFGTTHRTFYLGTNFVDTNYIRAQIFDLINEERLSRGLPELLFDQKLADVAQIWSEDVAKRKCLEHGDFESRMFTLGYESYQCGEIIEEIPLGGIGFFQTPLEREFVDGWLKSAGHREIMLMPFSGYLGVGCSKNSGSVYCVADFRFE